MKPWATIGLICFLANSGFAQSTNVDSLKRIEKTMQGDTSHILALLQIGNYYEGVNLDSSEQYYRKALGLSKDLDEPFYEGKTISWFTDVLNQKGKLQESLQLNLRSLEIGKSLNHTRLTVAGLANVANSYQYLGDYESTLRYQLEALPVLEKMGDPLFLSTGLNNVSGTYQLLRQHRKALPYAEKALEIGLDAENPYQISSATLSLGVIYSHLDQYDKAIEYLNRSLKTAGDNNFQQILALGLLNIGEVYKNSDRYQKALPYLLRGIPVAEDLGDFETLARLLQSAGNVNYLLDRHDEAADLMKRSVEISRRHGFRDALKEVYLVASDVELARRNNDLAAVYRKEYRMLSDSLINETVLKNTAELETKYKTAEKENENLRLQKQNEIQLLRLRQRQGIIIGLVALLGLSAGLGLLYYQNSRNRQRIAFQELEIGRQKILQLEREKQLSAVDAMLRGQEVERGRLARDLHDGLGGMLSGVRQTLNAMKGNQIITEESARSFNRALEMLDKSIGELRRVARNMMPEALLKFGLKDAVQDFCDMLDESGPVKVQFQAFGLEKRLPAPEEVIVFRIVQELLNNVVKHARASRALVQLLQDGDRFHITVEDDGKGFDTAVLEKAPGVGWLNIRSRTDYLGGSLDLRSTPGQGTSVEIEFKVKRNPGS